MIQSGVGLYAWMDRTPEFERLHDDYLRAIREVHRLDGDLVDLRTEITLLLDDCDALDRVCSFKRRPVAKLDRLLFCNAFPEEFKQCELPADPRLTKHVYPARSYLTG